jgi:hypothetical protein
MDDVNYPPIWYPCPVCGGGSMTFDHNKLRTLLEGDENIESMCGNGKCGHRWFLNRDQIKGLRQTLLARSDQSQSV